MADVDVKVAIEVAGDASGAQQVDEAVKQVGQTAEQVAQDTSKAAQDAVRNTAESAADSVRESSQKVADASKTAVREVESIKDALKAPQDGAGLDDQIGSITDALASLSPEKAKGAVSGLASAIVGLASGNTSKGLEGLARSLSSLASYLPNPALAAMVSAAVAGIVGAWKILRDDADESSRVVNEFGDTIEEEMGYLEDWANAQFDFQNLQNGISAIKSEFESAMQTTKAFTAAAKSALNVRTGAAASGLRAQAEQARSSGNEEAAAALEEKARREELVAKIVQEKVELESLVTQTQLQREAIRLAEENLAKQKDENQKLIDSFEQLKAKTVEWSGNIDAAFGGEARNKLIQKLEEEIAARELMNQRIYLSYTNLPSREGGWGPDTSGLKKVELPSQAAEIQSIRDFIEQLKLAEDRSESAAAALEKKNAGYSAEEAALKQAGQELVRLNAERITAAQEYATAIAGVDAQIAADAEAKARALTTSVETGAAALEKAADAGEGVLEAVDSFDGDISTASDTLSGSIETGADQIEATSDEAAVAVEEAGGRIAESVAGIGAEAESAGNEIKAGAEEFRAGAEEFRGKLAPAVENLVNSISSLSSTSGIVAAMVRDMFDSQLALSQEIASIRRQSAAALDQSALALQQNRNSR